MSAHDLSDDIEFGQTIRIPRFSPSQLMFNRFRLERVLGRGGMGVVWLARDQDLDRYVALKVLPETLCQDDASLSALKRETKMGLHLAHPNIVRIYEFYHDDAAAAISMEYVEGPTFSQIRSEKPNGVFTVAELQPYVAALCDALNYAHSRRRIVHRDLKPRNLMLDAESELKIADFGISRSISESVIMLTGVQGSTGSPPYMSPQQWDGAPPTALDDIYSLGATLYELLSSKPPFMGVVDWYQVHHTVPPPVSQRRIDLGIKDVEPLPPVWEDTIAACLSKDPKDRPQNVLEVQARLTNGQTTAPTATTIIGPPAIQLSPTPKTAGSALDALLSEDLSGAITERIDRTSFHAPSPDVQTSRSGDNKPSVPSPAASENVVPSGRSSGVSVSHPPAAEVVRPLVPSEPVGPTVTAAVVPEISKQPGPLEPVTPFIAEPVSSITSEEISSVQDQEPPHRLDRIILTRHKFPWWRWMIAAAGIALLFGVFLLWRKPAPPEAPIVTSGELSVETSPAGAKLILDGGQPVKAPYTFTNVNFGTHKLALTLDGYTSVERELRFDRSSSLRIDLQPKPGPPAEVATFSVRSDPPGALIRLDGVPPEKSPATFRDVKFGQHRLSATLEGFEPKEQTLDVDSQTKGQLVVNLTHAKPRFPDDTLRNLIAERKRYEDSKDGPNYRRVCLQLTRLLTTNGEPASAEHKDILSRTIDALRTKWGGLTDEEFTVSEEYLTSAAKHDVLPAVLVVADKLRGKKSPGAFAWYWYAAEVEHSGPAMTRLAWIYYLGDCGQLVDKPSAIKWFTLAHKAGEVDAGTVLASCYLRGDGVAQDADYAIRILQPLADAGDSHAKTLLAQCYYSGLGRFISLSQEERLRNAKKFYEGAIAAGDWDACGHLGVMYEQGRGVSKDLKKAAKLYWQGAEKENPICMYYYARGIENHGAEFLKIVGRNDRAETYYAKAAAKSVTEARNWCIDHNVDFAETGSTGSLTSVPEQAP
jgi:serine/threonine protein kinase/TPR repeat protein